jgi:hypothetical protein
MSAPPDTILAEGKITDEAQGSHYREIGKFEGHEERSAGRYGIGAPAEDPARPGWSPHAHDHEARFGRPRREEACRREEG